MVLVEIASKFGYGLRMDFFKSLSVPNPDCFVIHMVKGPFSLGSRYITASEYDLRVACDGKSADAIAVDFTLRNHVEESDYEKVVKYAHSKQKLVVADVSNLREGVMASSVGADYVATTLSGYTVETSGRRLPNTSLVKELHKKGVGGIIAEGGYTTPKQCRRARKYGAEHVCVGRGIWDLEGRIKGLSR